MHCGDHSVDCFPGLVFHDWPHIQAGGRSLHELHMQFIFISLQYQCHVYIDGMIFLRTSKLYSHIVSYIAKLGIDLYLRWCYHEEHTWYIYISIVKQLIQPITISVYMPGIGDWCKTDIMLSLAYPSITDGLPVPIMVSFPPSTTVMVIPNIFAIWATAIWSAYEPSWDISSM